MGKFTNTFKDSEVSAFSPDARRDKYDIDDINRDHNYWHEKIAQGLKLLAGSMDFYIIYGGVITDTGSGKIDISEGAAIGKDADGNIRLITIPALFNIDVPTGWNNSRQIWVIGQYASKITLDTREHVTTKDIYHYILEDTYVGHDTPFDMFVDIDPNTPDETTVVWGSFKMNGTAYSDFSDGTRTRSYLDISRNNYIKSGVYHNAIINGAMQVAQEQTSVTMDTMLAAYVCDNFMNNKHTAGGEITVSQSTTAPTGFNYSNKIDVVAAHTIESDEHFLIETFIEGYNYAPLKDKTVTLSFWCRSSKTGTFCIGIRNNGRDRSFVVERTIDSADTWEYKTITLTLNQTGGIEAFENGKGLSIVWTLGSGTTYQTGTTDSWLDGNFIKTSNQDNWLDAVGNDFYLTGVQLNEGPVALSFLHEDYGTVVRKCQRYLLKLGLNQYSILGHGVTGSTTNANIGVTFPVEMRCVYAWPSFYDLSVYNHPAGIIPVTSMPNYTIGMNCGFLECVTAGSLTPNNACYLMPSSNNGYLMIDARF